MTFQITDIPRILPELMLLVLALLVLGSDILEHWASDEQTQIERGRAAGQLTAIGLGLIFVVALVQSRFLFTVGEPGTNPILNVFLNLARNLQAGGPGGQPILGAFTTDNLLMIARLTFIGAAWLTSLLAVDYKPSGSPGEFYALLLFATAGMCIMAGASELILAYLAVELSSIALYVLAGYFRNDKLSSEAGLKYFLFGALSSAVLLYGMSLAYGMTAAINRSTGSGPVIATLFSQIGVAAQSGRGGNLLTLSLIFVIAGLGYKIAAVPFHSWSPDVYQGAPTPITAFISTASKTAGFLLLYRLLTTAFPTLAGSPGLENFGGWTSMLAILALLTMIYGNLAALPQTNAKRLLAYSSIGHAGFLLLAILIWSSALPSDRALGTSALLYYLISYTITNLGAFGALAVISERTGGDEIADLNGLWHRNIGLTTMFSVLLLSLAGIPPLAGFWAKFLVFMTGYRAGTSGPGGISSTALLVTVAVAMTIISLYYYLRLLKAMWMNPPASEEPINTPRSMRTVLIVTTALTVLLGLVPNLIWGILEQSGTIAGR